LARSLSKWTKYKLLARSKKIRKALPKTLPFGESAFRFMLDRCGSVYVKPVRGSGGAGVVKVTSGKDGRFVVHHGAKKMPASGAAEAYAIVRRKTGHRSCLVQQTVKLLTVGGRPFDVRVMVQRTGRSHWTATAKLAKIAGPGHIITNVARSGGRVASVKTALRRSGFGERAGSISRRLDRIALAAVRRLHKFYPWINTVGMDLGVDRRGKVWIIEANFKPAKSLFRRLKDKSAYHRIMRYYSRRGK